MCETKIELANNVRKHGVSYWLYDVMFSWRFADETRRSLSLYLCSIIEREDTIPLNSVLGYSHATQATYACR